MRLAAVGIVAAAILLCSAGVSAAQAEIRTAHYTNRSPTSTGSAIDPQVQSILLQYDSSGSLTAQLHFFHALVDSSQTSALHDAFVWVMLGDAFGADGFPDCDASKAGIALTVNLGPGLATTASDQPYGPPLDIPAQSILTPDRTELDVTVQDPRFAGMNLICWSVSAQNQADTSDRAGFDSGFRLMDGFTPEDGNVAYVANQELNDEARWVNNDLGHPGKNPLYFIRGNPFHCRLDHFGGVNCRGSYRMPAIVGKPVLRIKGSQFFTVDTVFGDEQELAWHHSEHASLSWERCPAAIHPSVTLLGHPCHISVSWAGTKDLYRVFEGH
jgi:hypothetical protein